MAKEEKIGIEPIIHIHRRSPSEEEGRKFGGKGEYFKGKAWYVGAKTARQQWLLPLLLSLLVIIFIVGPSITIILNIISKANPLVWIVVLLAGIFFYKRFIA